MGWQGLISGFAGNQPLSTPNIQQRPVIARAMPEAISKTQT
jgi:hypothetical protein